MTLTAREQRLIAIGILVLLLAAIWLGVVHPIVEGFHHRAQERANLIAQQLRGEHLIGEAPYWRSRQRALRADMPAYSLVAHDAPTAAEEAVELVSDAVNHNGGTVRAVREMPGSPGVIRLHVDVRLNLTQLLTCLKLLENQRPFAVIESLSIAADPATSAGQFSTLDVGIDLALPFVGTNG